MIPILPLLLSLVHIHRSFISQLVKHWPNTMIVLQVKLYKHIVVVHAISDNHFIFLQTLRQTNKELTEAIEAEKTTHLESKFNSELVQV